jgi:hypothetical protein
MDAAYLRAANPKPFTILGKRLKRFCLGHETLFQTFGNRFSVESTEEPSFEDLFKGVYICSRRYSQDVTLENFSVPLRARIYGKLDPFYIQDELGRFKEYIAAHTELPDFYSTEDGESRNVGTPTIQAVKVSLMARLGVSSDEALNTSYSLAFWDHLTWMEGQGTIQIIDEAEAERIRQSDEDYAKMEALLLQVGAKLQREHREQERRAA